MATLYNFKPTCHDDDGCFAPKPDFDCVDTCQPCNNPCEPKCPPKVRAKDAVCLSDDECERCFSLFQYVGCDITKVPAHIYAIVLKVRRQGNCRVLVEECPTRSDNKGNVCFVWSEDFRQLPAGYYEADVVVNDRECFTLLFRKRGCWTRMVTEEVKLAQLPCEAPPHCEGCVATPDFEQTAPEAECGGCDNVSERK